ncbi:M23 family metallopeptidase, partial [bacterium]
MSEPSTSNLPDRTDADLQMEQENNEAQPAARRGWNHWWEQLVRMGLGEVALRVGTGIASLVMILVVVWVMRNFYLKGDVESPPSAAAMAAILPTATPEVEAPAYVLPDSASMVNGVPRLTVLHTTLPSRPRFDVIQYTVVEGDTIFDIAEKFGLQPETLLWGNQQTLGDDPHRLVVGVTLNILPTDGVYYEWHEGDGLNSVAKYFKVAPEDILNWPGNKLSADTIGDFSSPNIAAGTWLVIPGGSREFVSWSAPRITRENPAVARLYGAGACGTIVDGAVGTGGFIWPTTNHWLSGYDYSLSANHPGIDIGGQSGNAIYAADSGVVVYSGWNDLGYGYVVVIDHGNGWQTTYAHLSQIYAGCGASVTQGATIGLMGTTGNSTGPHLHFEMYNDTYGKVNPHQFLN